MQTQDLHCVKYCSCSRTLPKAGLDCGQVQIVITFYLPSCLGQETAKGPFDLRVKLPPARLSTQARRQSSVTNTNNFFWGAQNNFPLEFGDEDHKKKRSSFQITPRGAGPVAYFGAQFLHRGARSSPEEARVVNGLTSSSSHSARTRKYKPEPDN